MNHIKRCETCIDTTCWLCKGNAYYDKAFSSKHQSNKEAQQEIKEYWQFTKQKGCASHIPEPSAEDKCPFKVDEIICSNEFAKYRHCSMERTEPTCYLNRREKL